MPRRDGGTAFTVEIAPSFAAARDDWEQMAEGGAALPFQRRDWLDVWADTLGREPRLDMLPVTVRDAGGRAILALPLLRRRSGRLRTITFADGGLADYNAPILMSGSSWTLESAQVLWRSLRAALPPADLIRFEKMPASVGGLANPLALLDPARPSRAIGLALSLSGTYEDWRKQLPSHFRKEIGRCERLFDALPGAAFRVSTPRDDTAPLMTALERLQRERIGELGLPYALDEEAPQALYRRLAATCPNGILTSITTDDDVLGVLFGLRQGDSYVMLRLGIADQRYRHLSPGRHLITQTMRALAADGVTSFDFGLGDYEYKRKLGGLPIPLSDLVAAVSPLGLGPLALERLRTSLAPDTQLGSAARRLKARWTNRR